MSNYRRLFIPGGTFFFTVNLLDRRARLLTENIDALRAANGLVARDHPFETVATPEDWPHSTYHEWKKEFGRPINVPPGEWKPVHLGER